MKYKRLMQQPLQKHSQFELKRFCSVLKGMLLICMLSLGNAAYAFSPENNFSGPSEYKSELESVLRPIRHAQNRTDSQRQSVRSRNEVVREVKQRYKAEVLKISLNQQRSAYNVRIMMPNGKVRVVRVNARR